MVSSVDTRVADLQAFLVKEKSAILIPEWLCRKLVLSMLRAERTRAPPTVAGQAPLVSRALLALVVELCEVFPDLGTTPVKEATRLIFGAQETVGDPWTWVSALCNDVTAYEAMVGPLLDKCRGRAGQSWPRRWWTRPWAIALLLWILLAVALWLSWDEELAGRAKLIRGGFGLFGVLVGLGWMRWGSAGWKVSLDQVPDDLIPDDPAPADAATGSTSAPDTDSMAQLRSEIARLRASQAGGAGVPAGVPALPSPGLGTDPVAAAGSSAGFNALMNFGTGAPPPGGFITQTAQNWAPGTSLAGLASAGPSTAIGVPPLPPPAQAPQPANYAPLQPAMGVSLADQSRELSVLWDQACAAAASDQHWLARFWAGVADYELRVGLHPSLSALVRAHGYTGGQSTAMPAASFGADLLRLRQHGLQPVASQLPGTGDAAVRYDLQLAPGLRRAALEIYTGLRTQGAASTREWLTSNYPNAKSDHRWVDLWSSAVAVDFEIGQSQGAELERKLSTSDSLEMHLRRLASYVYEARTHDTKGAQRLLATRPPGMQLDIAPEWMVQDATAYTKLEYQREGYVRGGGRGGRTGGGRPNNRGSENPQDGPATAGGGGAASSSGGDGGGSGRARGRGRGRGRS